MLITIKNMIQTLILVGLQAFQLPQIFAITIAHKSLLLQFKFQVHLML